MQKCISMEVLLIDDHSIVRSYLKNIVKDYFPDSICVEASCEKEAMNYINLNNFNLVILDIVMPDSDSFNIVKNIKLQSPQSKILILTSYEYDTYIIQLLKLGIGGYVNKNSSNKEIETALLTVANNMFYISESVRNKLTDIVINYDINLNPFHRLNKKEYLIAIEILKGKNNLEISSTLGIPKATVIVYKNSLLNKLKIKENNIVDFVKLAIKYKVISEFE